jgi:hypothetical protein
LDAQVLLTVGSDVPSRTGRYSEARNDGINVGARSAGTPAVRDGSSRIDSCSPPPKIDPGLPSTLATTERHLVDASDVQPGKLVGADEAPHVGLEVGGKVAGERAQQNSRTLSVGEECGSVQWHDGLAGCRRRLRAGRARSRSPV